MDTDLAVARCAEANYVRDSEFIFYRSPILQFHVLRLVGSVVSIANDRGHELDV